MSTTSLVITTREFGPTVEYGIGVYAHEKNKNDDHPYGATFDALNIWGST